MDLQVLRPLGSKINIERLSTVEIELKRSLAGTCTPGDTITCVGVVKVITTEIPPSAFPNLDMPFDC